MVSKTSVFAATKIAAEFWVFAGTAARYAMNQALAVFCEQIDADKMTSFLLGMGAGFLTKLEKIMGFDEGTFSNHGGVVRITGLMIVCMLAAPEKTKL